LEPDLLYTPEEAAALLRVRASWLRRRAGARLVPCTFLGRHLRFSAADLAAIVADHELPVERRRRRRRSTSPATSQLTSAPAAGAEGLDIVPVHTVDI
jgi:excisionase family DNA binding protein